MKVFKATTRRTKQLKSAILNTIEYNDRFKNCYFWSNTGNAASRRSQEDDFKKNNPSYEIITKKGVITVEPLLSISCANFYYSLDVRRDDKKSNITILKNLIKG
jgi:hypothetical protein